MENNRVKWIRSLNRATLIAACFFVSPLFRRSRKSQGCKRRPQSRALIAKCRANKRPLTTHEINGVTNYCPEVYLCTAEVSRNTVARIEE